MINRIKKFLKERRDLKRFNEYFGTKGLSREELVKHIEDLSRPSFHHKKLLTIMKANTIRGRISGKVPYLKVMAPANKLDKLKEIIDEIGPFATLVEYESLKWYEGWFPRYYIEGN